jgi:hypothetical protein
MATSFLGRAPKNSYQEVVKVDNTGAGFDTTLRAIADGTGTASQLKLSTTTISLNGQLWPTSLGSNGQFLTTDASGNLSWGTVNLSSYAPLASPALTGTPTAPTATTGTNTTQIATTAFVQSAVSSSGVSSFNTRTGAVTLQASDISGVGGALWGQLPISINGFVNANSFALTSSQYEYQEIQFTGTINGNVTVTFPTSGSWVVIASYSDGGIGYRVTATNGQGTSITLVPGNTYFFASEGSSGLVQLASNTATVTSFNTRTGAVTLQSSDITSAGGAVLASPAFTGTPTAPTAAQNTNTTQLATTAFVLGQASSTTPSMAGTAAVGTGTTFARADHVHPVDTSRASASSPTITGRTQSDAYSYTVTALGSVSGTQTLNLGIASEWTMTIAGATTIAFTNTLAANTGQVIYLRIANGGSATITWPSGTKFSSGTAPSLTTSGVDLLGVVYDTTSSTYMVFVIGLNIQ